MSSTGSRRSIRMRRSDNYSDLSRKRRSCASKFKSLRHCRKKHSCFAIGAKHFYPYLDCGKFGDKQCGHCDALMLKSESNAMCCANGAVVLDLIERMDPEMENLLDSPEFGRNFRKNFRVYNNLLSFGSIEAGRKPAPGNGPPVVLMNGEVKHCVSSLFTRHGRAAVHGQLYMLDPDTACAEMQKNSLYQRMNLATSWSSVYTQCCGRTHWRVRTDIFMICTRRNSERLARRVLRTFPT